MNFKTGSLLWIVCFFAGISFNLSIANGAWTSYWLYPETGTVFNPQSNEGFEKVVFKGLVYDNVTGEGFFHGDFNSVTVEFTNGGQTLSSSVQTEDVTVLGNTEYKFEVDLSGEELSALTEGEWNVQISFDVSGQSTVIQTNWGGTVGIDKTPPTVLFSYTPDTFTNDVVEMSIACSDSGAGCLEDNPSLPVPFMFGNPFDFSVLGNFSTEFENGVRGFGMCDKVMNCTSKDNEKLNINFYDPVNPMLQSGITVERDGLSPLTGEGGFEANTMSADDNLVFSLLGVNDPAEIDTYTQDNHACGRDEDDDTYLAEDIQVSFDVVSGDGFPGVWVHRERDGGVAKKFLFQETEGINSYAKKGIVVNGSDYEFRLTMKVGEESFDYSPYITIGESWNGTLGTGTSYETQFSNFTANIVPNSQRCTSKYFVCAVNHPAGGGYPQRVEMTEFDDAGQTCADKRGANWELFPTTECGFPLIFPFVLEDCEN